jgi:hypothetical protein
VRARRAEYAFLLIWLFVMALPSALTEFAPNFRRAIGAMPAMILLIALGLDWLAERARIFLAHRPRPRSPLVTAAPLLALVLALLLSAYWSARAYFVDWAANPGLFYSFDQGILQLGRILAARPQGESLYLTPDYSDHPTVQWALDGRRVISFDGRRGFVSSLGAPATYGIISYEDDRTLARLNDIAPGAPVGETVYDWARAPYAVAMTLPPQALVLPTLRPASIRVGDFAYLEGWEIAPDTLQPGSSYEVTLLWKARGHAAEDYTVFVHLVGPVAGPGSEATSARVRAQADSQPLGETFPTGEWRPGGLVLDTHILMLPSELPPGRPYVLQVGMYKLATGQRVPLFDAGGNRVPADAAVLSDYDIE